MVKANHGGTDYIYLMTGMGMIDSGTAQYAVHYYNDIWRSSDGITWVEVEPKNGSSESVDIGQRSGAAAFENEGSERIYLLGGLTPVIFDDGADGVYNGYPSDNRLWFLSGRSNSIAHIDYTKSDNLYNTYDGSNWILDSDSSGVGARYGNAATVHDNKLLVVGVRTADMGPG